MNLTINCLIFGLDITLNTHEKLFDLLCYQKCPINSPLPHCAYIRTTPFSSFFSSRTIKAKLLSATSAMLPTLYHQTSVKFTYNLWYSHTMFYVLNVSIALILTVWKIIFVLFVNVRIVFLYILYTQYVNEDK